jgi:hypothetical protein
VQQPRGASGLPGVPREVRRPDLWEGNKKTIRIPSLPSGQRYFGAVDRVRKLLIEARYALDGLTVKDVLDLARTAVGVDVELAEDGLVELRLSTPTRSGLHCTGEVCQRVKRQTQRRR